MDLSYELTVADTYDWANARIQTLLDQQMYREATDLYAEFNEWLVETDKDHEVLFM